MRSLRHTLQVTSATFENVVHDSAACFCFQRGADWRQEGNWTLSVDLSIKPENRLINNRYRHKEPPPPSDEQWAFPTFVQYLPLRGCDSEQTRQIYLRKKQNKTEHNGSHEHIIHTVNSWQSVHYVYILYKTKDNWTKCVLLVIQNAICFPVTFMLWYWCQPRGYEI